MVREHVDAGIRQRAKQMAASDPFPIQGFSHLEWWVGNAYQMAHYLRALMGFQIIGYRGPETGVRDTASYLLASQDIRFVLTGAMRPDHPVAQFVHSHGPGVRDVAFMVPDVEAAYEMALARGAISAYAPHVVETERGKAMMAGVEAYGDTIHSLVRRDAELPDFEPRADSNAVGIGLRYVDHVVANVELGRMNELAEYYQRVFGFSLLRHFTDEAISTEYSALMSKVMWDGTGIIKLPINEPAHGLRRSQIEEYVEFFQGAGVQHIAMATDDLQTTVEEATRRGVGFLRVPDNYYDEVPNRIAGLDVDLERVKQLRILLDQDSEGHLLQIFTRMLQDRPTVFFEFIERRGAKGFGEGNFKALFEAIEAEQAERGNL